MDPEEIGTAEEGAATLEELLTGGEGDNAAAEGVATGDIEAEAEYASDAFLDGPEDFDWGEDEEEGVEASGEEEAVESEEPEVQAAPEEQEEEKVTSRAQERIQRLANERRELAEQLQTFQAQTQQQQQQVVGYIQNMQQQYEQRLSQMQQELDRRKEAEEDEQLSPYERDQRQRAKKLEEAHKAEIQGLRNEWQQAEQAKQRAAAAERQKAERESNLQALERMTDQAVDKFLSEYPEQQRAEMREETKDAYLSYCVAYGYDPNTALPKFQKWAKGLSAPARTKEKASTVGAAVKKSRQAPKAAGPRRIPAKGNETRMPTLSKLYEDGRYSDHVEWMAAGSPQLRS